MSPQEKQEFEQMKRDIAGLKRDTTYGVLPDKIIFDKTILANEGIKFPNNRFIYGGSATTDASIKLDVGTPAGGSIYISSNGTGEVWVMLTTTWTKLSIP